MSIIVGIGVQILDEDVCISLHAYTWERHAYTWERHGSICSPSYG